MTDQDPPEDPHNDFPESWETFWRDGEAWGRTDTEKEFRLNAGSTEVQDGRCGTPIKDYERRYGEIRYCTQMPESTFVDDGSDYCRMHKSMDALMKQAHELFKHGYFASNYVNFAQKISGEKFLFAIEMFDGLVEQSRHDFEIKYDGRAIDMSESKFIAEDSVNVELPFPTNNLFKFQAQELWYASLASVMQQNMHETVFEEGVSQETIAQSADMEGKITDVKYEKQEHHLHLPISRVSKDIKEHLKNGGVSIKDDDDGDVLTFQKNDYTLSVGDDGPDSDGEENEVETLSADQFTKDVESDEAAAEIEVE
jgi:hypothetical protein